MAAKVHQILGQDLLVGRTWKEGMDKLWALGPNVIAPLAAEAGVRDSLLSKYYPKLWTNSPQFLKRHLPHPIDRPAMRQAAMQAIEEFGPLAVRRSARQVIEGLRETDDRYNNHAVKCVRWLLPQSASALATFENALAGVDSNGLAPDPFLSAGDGTVYAEMPGIVPLLTKYLSNSGYSYLAAIDLGQIGSNAATAVPALIQTADMGAAGFPDAEAARLHQGEGYSIPIGWHKVTFISDDKSMNHDRAMAALALGRIGVATPEVCAALVRAWNAPDAWVRHNAALAVAQIGLPMTNDLPGLLAGLRDHDNEALHSKLQAIGRLGPAARDALATLLDLTQTNRLRTLVTDPGAEVVGWSVDDQAVSAKIAICRIDQEEGRLFLPDIANKIGFWWDPVVFLIEPTSLSNEVVRAVEPLLDQTGSSRQSIAAYVILHQNRNHAKALAVLRRNKSTGQLNDRLLAGRLLFESAGETNGLCDLLAEGFESPESFLGQSAGYQARKMGEAARPALPAFKKAMWHHDVFVRQQAGELVIKLAPEEIPINEAK
jgi:hypothetical protein